MYWNPDNELFYDYFTGRYLNVPKQALEDLKRATQAFEQYKAKVMKPKSGLNGYYETFGRV